MSKAVFISCAHEDADTAGRIAEALRHSGIEVWFDWRELRGGDSWDAVIRRQIRECALFLAVISAQSDQRHEGYFRSEWLLAIERVPDLPENVPFLFPVVIDETTDSVADVPEAFKRVRWTRLPGGKPDALFTGLVRDLLDGRRRPAPGAPVASQAPRPTSHPQKRPVLAISIVLGALIAIAATAWMLR